MKMRFADRMKDYEAGIFQVLNEKKIQVEGTGKRVFNFSVGTPDFKPSDRVTLAVSRAASIPENYKYSLRDLPELTDAVRERFANRYGVSLQSDEIMSLYGSQEGLAHVCLSLVNPGDVVLVPNPGYPIFSVGPSLAGARIETYDLYEDKGYLPNLEEIAEKYGKNATEADHARVMIVSYPLNPVCKCAPDSFYEELIRWAEENEIFILHDNAYSDIVYDGKTGRSILSFSGAKDVAAEFYSLSKSYNYTGARMSFLVGAEPVISNFKKLRSQIDYGIFYPIQYGAIAALTGSDDFVRTQCLEYEKRRNALCDGFTELGWQFARSEGTMFAWAKIPDRYGDRDVDFVMDLLEQTGVLCTPGSSFGSLGKGHVRFALVLPVETIREALDSVKTSGILKG